MDAINDLIRIGRLYAAHTGIENTTLSWRLFGDSKKFDALLGGADLQTRRHASAVTWLDQNWPADLPWPDDVLRPSVKSDHGEAPVDDGVTLDDPAPLGAENRRENITRTEAVS